MAAANPGLGDARLPGELKRIALVCDETIGDRMGAGGIRFWRFARHLRDSGIIAELFARCGSGNYDGFTVRAPERFFSLHSEFDAVIAGTLARRGLPGLQAFRGPLVHDLICPFMLENRHVHAGMPELKRRAWEREFARDFAAVASRASAYLVASPSQRLFWTGWLSAADVWHADCPDPPPVVELPNGMDACELSPDAGLADDVVELARKMDSAPGRKWLMTNGGLYSWTLVEPVIRALAILRKEGRDAGLVVLGADHPGHRGATSNSAARVPRLRAELGLGDELLVSGWLPHRQRFHVLKRAALGVHLHPQGLETELSYRTRLLDFASAEVPVATSIGGVVSEMLIESGAALPITNLEPENVAWVLGRAMDAAWGENYRAAVAGLRLSYSWETVLPRLEQALELARNTPPPRSLRKGPAPGGFAETIYRAMRGIVKVVAHRQNQD
ncbi:MAG: hypothetical protein HRF49_02460 [bacterium]|jgi:glycosyltransferase involved in cell wall biosynthesis